MSQRVWKVASLVSLMAALAAALPLTSDAASAAGPPKCAELQGGQTRRGAAVDQLTCTAGRSTQEWAPVLIGPGGRFGNGIYQLQSAATHMCLEVYNGPTGRGTRDMRNGATVDQWTCFKGHFNQEWDARIVANNGRHGHPVMELVNHQSGKCLEVENWSTNDGARVDQWTCFAGHANQEWEPVLAPIHGGADFQLVNENG
jgi:Ricin-type beta-trefoil lectin domain